jgi:TetR/AcrR family transcriptional repressor of nem operon
MKVSREQAALNRERVLNVAAQLYREHGFEGVGVADIMKAAGLTHGGFYGQFTSKEELMAKVGERIFADSQAYWQRLVEASPDDPFGAIVRSYLSSAHRDQPGQGCALAALGADVARSPAPVRRTFTEGFRVMMDMLAGLMPGRLKAARREKALFSYAAMIGGLVLARTVDDPALSEEILHAVLDSLREQER